MMFRSKISIDEVIFEKPSEYGISGYDRVWGYDISTQTWSTYFAKEVEDRWTSYAQYIQDIKNIVNADKDVMNEHAKASALRDMEYMKIIAWLPAKSLPEVVDHVEQEYQQDMLTKKANNNPQLN